jgi:hypothetical protein
MNTFAAIKKYLAQRFPAGRLSRLSLPTPSGARGHSIAS